MAYRPGQEIITNEEPFSHIIGKKYRSQYCDWCAKKEAIFAIDQKMIKCNKCNEFSYCNLECQRKAYAAYHKSECGKLKKIPSDIIPRMRDILIFMGRTIKKVQNGGDKIIAKLPDGTKRRFADLMAHEEEILHVHTDLIATFKTPWCQTFFEGATFEYLVSIFGKITINQHGILSPSLDACIGDALYIGAAAIGKKHALKMFDWFALITSCFWRENQFH